MEDRASQTDSEKPSTCLRAFLWGWVVLTLGAWLYQFRPLIEAALVRLGS